MQRIVTLLQEALQDVNIKDSRAKRLLLKLRRLYQSPEHSADASRNILDDLTQHAGNLHDDALIERVRYLRAAAASSHESAVGSSASRRRSRSADLDTSRPVKRPKTSSLTDLQLLYEYLHPLPATSTVPLVRDILADAALAGSATSPERLKPGAITLLAIWKVVEPLVPARSARLIGEARAITASLADMTPASELKVCEALLNVMAQLCAPVRDAQVHELRNTLASLREFTAKSEAEKRITARKHAMNEAYQLANDMQADHARFKAGALAVTRSEDALRIKMREETMQRERALLCDDSKEEARSWIQQAFPDTTASVNRNSMTHVLLSALFSDRAVFTPEQESHALPAILHVSARRLLWVQNMLQAVVVIAALATIIPTTPSTVQPDWSERIWRLLASVMSENRGSGSQGDRFSTANIADEIMAALKASSADRARIQERVNALLRHNDPVARLLRERLHSSALQHLTEHEAWLPPNGFKMQPLPTQAPLILAQIHSAIEWASEAWHLV